MSKNFDATVCLQSEKRQEWIREIRGERLQGIAEGGSAPVWLAHQPRRSPGETSVRGLIASDRTGGERIQFLPDLPQSLR